MKTLIVISSKSPNPTLFECIEKLYRKQIQTSKDYKICVVDSDSDDISEYKKIQSRFPEVEVHFVKNKNYEYGAWKYAIDQYPGFDIYMCIQDTMLVLKQINLDLVTENQVYACLHYSGFYHDISLKPRGI